MSFATIGAPELIIILVIVLVVFGSTQLPRLARSLGQAQKEFKKGVQEGDSSNSGKGKNGSDAKHSPEAESASESTFKAESASEPVIGEAGQSK